MPFDKQQLLHVLRQQTLTALEVNQQQSVSVSRDGAWCGSVIQTLIFARGNRARRDVEAISTHLYFLAALGPEQFRCALEVVANAFRVGDSSSGVSALEQVYETQIGPYNDSLGDLLRVRQP